jgi:DNA-binding CsgD family transcriptional regulator
LPVDQSLLTEFGLTRREAECATLLRYGVTPAKLAKRLNVSDSTLQKHLSCLRQKTGKETTGDLVNFLRQRPADDNIAAYHSWPPLPVATLAQSATLNAPYQALAEECRGKLQLVDMLGVMRDHLAGTFGVRYVLYTYAPLSVTGFLRDDVMRAALAPPQVVNAFENAGPVLESPSAQKLFANPDQLAFVDGRSADYDNASPGVQAFYDACLADGVRYGVSFGFPSGGAFVGMSVSLDEKVDDAEALIREKGEEIRAAAMVTHSCAWTYGALAAAYGLTITERNALGFLAQGRRISDTAKLMKMSERALGYLLIGARRKLAAKTNAEAVCKAAAANILVFR